MKKMLVLDCSWAMAQFLTDNFNHDKIPFGTTVTGYGRAVVVIYAVDLERAEKYAHGWKEL